MTEQEDTPHQPAEHLALYFRGLLDEAAQHAVEAHVALCNECAQRLRVEAQLELSLHKMLEVQALPSVRPRRRTRIAVSFAVTGAAALVLALAAWRMRAPTSIVRAEGSTDERTTSMQARQAVVSTLLGAAWAAPVVGCSAQVGDATAAVVAAAPAALDVALPDGWIRAGSAPTAYSMGIDRVNLHADSAPMALASKPNATFREEDFGTVMTKTDAAPYHGKRVRLTGFVRAAEVTGWAGLWMRVDGEGKQILAFDNMQARPICATSDWTRYDVVLDVADSATKIAFGALLTGRGSIWFDVSNLEIVDASVATTGSPATSRVSATFEAASTRGLTSKWFLTGSAADSYVATADATVHHGGTSSVSLASTGAPSTERFGTAMQNAPVFDAFRGSRVRLSAYVKAENVRGWAGLWLRIDGPPSTKPLAFDNMQDRPIKGTLGWALYSIVLNVPAEARNIALGVILAGEGHVWMDDVGLERVGQ
jgi:hypothetical protein